MISTKQKKEAEMSNGNEVTISINVSDDLLDKVMSAMVALTAAQNKANALPMMLGGLLPPMGEPPSEKAEKKSTIGFKTS